VSAHDKLKAAMAQAASNGPPPDPSRVFIGSLGGMALDAALERARVVGVLDAWAERTGVEPAVYRSLSKPGLWCCDCDGLSDPDARRCFYGDSRDAARAAAAKAIEAGEV
jgi:hypothetical protein